MGEIAGNEVLTSRMDIYWRPHHEVHPELAPDQDFIAFDGEQDIGRVYLMTSSQNAGRWSWSMYAHSHTGRVPFLTSGVEDRRGDAGQRVVEAYRLLLAHNERHPRNAPHGTSTGGAKSVHPADTQRGLS